MVHTVGVQAIAGDLELRGVACACVVLGVPVRTPGSAHLYEVTEDPSPPSTQIVSP